MPALNTDMGERKTTLSVGASKPSLRRGNSPLMRFLCLYFQDLLTSMVAAGAASPVQQASGAALRTGRERRHPYSPVGASPVSSCLAVPSF